MDLTDDFLDDVAKRLITARRVREKFLAENKNAEDLNWIHTDPRDFEFIHDDWAYNSKERKAAYRDAMREFLAAYETALEQHQHTEKTWARPWPGERNK